MYSAGLFIAIPALVVAGIGILFGEGDYLIPIMAILYACMFVFGNRMRRAELRGTVRRSRGFWIAIYSIMLSGMCIAMTLTFLLAGEWR